MAVGSRIPASPQPILDRTIRIETDFLRINSEFALTFAGTAFAAIDAEKRRRAALAARKAHDTIARLMGHIQLTEAARDKLDANLLRLEAELQRLGECARDGLLADGEGFRADNKREVPIAVMRLPVGTIIYNKVMNETGRLVRIPTGIPRPGYIVVTTNKVSGKEIEALWEPNEIERVEGPLPQY